MGILWEQSVWVFLIYTCLIAGGAAWMAGRGLALGWRPYWRVLLYMTLFGMAVRFFNWGLFEGELLSLHFFLVDTAVLILSASLAYRITRATQMATQYRWLYRRTSPFTWTER